MSLTERLTQESFDAVLAGLKPSRPLGVAVSGGPDSLALLALTRNFAETRGYQVHAVTVDHGLRSASAGEAKDVASICAELGVSHDTLVWQDDKPSANVQAEARRARYRLMADWCEAKGISSLLLAHHFDDQVETFLLRLMRGSGVDGLSAMSPSSPLPGRESIRLLRPLLAFEKPELEQIVKEAGWPVAYDPSNDDPKYDRVKIRQLRNVLEDLGLEGDRLARTAARMSDARAALDSASDAAVAQWVTYSDLGFASLDWRGLGEVPTEIGRRLVARLLQEVSGREYRPRFEKTDRLYQELKSGAIGSWTLHHVHVQSGPQEALFWREMRPDPEIVDLSEPGLHKGIWDGRFHFEVVGHPGMTLQGLGEAGWRYLKELDFGLFPAGVPKGALLGLPAFWRGGEVIAAPNLGFFSIQARCRFARLP